MLLNVLRYYGQQRHFSHRPNTLNVFEASPLSWLLILLHGTPVHHEFMPDEIAGIDDMLYVEN
jgi:hypothetical protein